MLRQLTGIVVVLAAFGGYAEAQITLFDFTKSDHGWRGNPRTRMQATAEGLKVELTGEDPWIEGSYADIPGEGNAPKLRVVLDANCSNSGECRLFFAGPEKNFTEDDAINLQPVEAPTNGYMGIIPLKSKRLRFRIDPPGSSGTFSLRSLKAEPLTPLVSGSFAPPAALELDGSVHAVSTKHLRCIHSAERWNAFACYVNGLRMLESNPDESLMYWNGSKAVAVKPERGETTVENVANGFHIRCRTRDADGSDWEFNRRFKAENNEITVETSIKSSQSRDMAHLPWLTLFSGKGTFGDSKQQALLPGVEYLENEPSSNEKEVKGEAANRRLVERYKLCYPLMAISAENRWVSLAWDEMPLPASPVFDSPDRIFKSGGHLMGLWSPAVGKERFQGELEVYGCTTLEAGKLYTCKAVIRGGAGHAIAKAVEDYVTRTGLPPLPEFKAGFEGAVELLSYGWLDSAARDGLRWRHAVFGDRFPPSLAPDVPVYLLWLAANARDADLKSRLNEAAQETITQLPEGHQGVGGVSHIKLPTGALLYGNLESLVTQAAGQVKGRVAALDKTGGRAIYKPADGKPDYASTLGSNHCNGYTAITMERMLQDATLTGDSSAINAALRVLDRMTQLYADEVPRGAQPWEMPLHTPDIMASAGLVRCYVLGYLLSGRENLLEQARYWAWTGVAMVYLTPPVDGEIGVYSTIGVIGATNWTAPNWIGQPVQWCGLVYRSALEDLARVDSQQGDTWRKIARGITLAGLQMSWPKDDPENRGGLLPDYILLKEQRRDGPAINPGTVQANVAEVFGKTPMYTVTRLQNGMLVHAPGETITEGKSKNGYLQMKVDAWPSTDYKVLITGVQKEPASVNWNDKVVKTRYLDKANALIVYLRGDGRLSVSL